MPEFDLEQWLETTGETEDFELDAWLTKTSPVEDDRPWWQKGWEKTKDIYEWMYPRGIEDLPRQYGAALTEAGMKVGEGATWLARLAPEQEDLAAWEDQDIPRQALTLAQATSLVALGSLIGYTGISAIGSLAKNLAYGRADRIAERFATQHFDKIKRLNPQVKTPEDAAALAQASLRGVVAPTVETTYLPTTMAKLRQLGTNLLQPLAKSAPTTQFKTHLTTQVSGLLKELVNKSPSEELMLPFLQTIEHHVGNPATGMITAEYGRAIAPILSDKILPMFEQIRQVGKAVAAIDIAKAPPPTITEKVTAPDVGVEPLAEAPLGEEIPEGITIDDFPEYLRPALSDELARDVKFETWEKTGGYFDQETNTIYYPKGDEETLTHELMHLIEHSPAINELTKSLTEAGYYKKGEVGKMLQWYLTSENGFSLANTEPKAWLIINDFLKKYDVSEVLKQNPEDLKELKELAKVHVSAFAERAPRAEAPPEVPPAGETVPKAEVPHHMQAELNIGGGPAVGMGIDLTTKQPTEPVLVEPEVKGALKKAVDWTTKTFSVYSRVKKEFPEAYQMFREFKGGQELAWINAKEENEKIWGRIAQDEALAVQKYRQNPEKYPLESLPEDLRPVAQRLDKAMEDSLADFQAMGKMKVGWPQSYIEALGKRKEKLLKKIPLLKQPKAIQKRQTRIKEIDELTEVLKTRRFFPGRYYDTTEGEHKVIKFLPEGVFRGSQIRQHWIKGKVIPDVDKAIELGLEPKDPRAATVEHLAWKEIEKNKWALYQGLKADPNLVMKERNAPEWWDDATGLKELKGYKINPIISDVLKEFEWTDPKGNLEQAYWKVARVGKIASFYNPLIMGGVYDPQQGYAAAGIRVANPLLMARSVKSALIKDDFYKMCVKADLFPKPVDLGPQRDMPELASSVARQMDIDTPKFARLIEKWTDGKWDFKDQTNTEKILKTVKGFYSGLWNTTWMLDAASRMNTVKVLLARGWNFTKAVERARFYHADYGDIPAGTRRFANYFMWTPSYQTSMAKVYGNMVRHPLKEKGPITRTILFQILAAAGMAMLGYKWQQGNRYVKSISKTEEDVITNPGPLFWLNKNLVRLGTNPAALFYYQASVPLNIIFSIMMNYDGLGGRVFDPKASEVVQAAQTALFSIERYLRPLEAAGRLTDEARPVFDRMLQLIAITKYQRTKRKPAKKKTPVGWHWR